MLKAFTVLSAQQMAALPAAKYSVTLRFDEREKSRHKTQTDCGQTLGWFIERGHILAQGEGLQTEQGDGIEVRAAKEKLSVVTATSPHVLMRAAYHLGNRHVPLQVNEQQLCYLCDYVLDDMVRGLGLSVATVDAPFCPEPGAYHSHGDAAGTSHGHSHSDSHSHDDGHSHSGSHSHSDSHSDSHSHSHSSSHNHSHSHSHSSGHSHEHS